MVALTSIFVMTGILVGCSSAPKEPNSPTDIPNEFSASGTRKAPDRWWTAFDDERLSSLVDQALKSNFNLKTAWSRLREARSIVDRESSRLYPDLDGLAQGEISGGDSGVDERLRLGLTSEYEVDLWGRIESRVEAERYRARATLEDYRTAALSLSAEVVRTWYQLVEAHNQYDLLTDQIKTNQKVLSLLKTRFGSGQIRRADILRQEQLLESTREQRLATESRMQLLEHQLAVLLGKPPPEEVRYTNRDLPDLPPLPETGLPATLVRRRPDVVSAFHELRAADSDLAAAISNQYPRLTFTASLATTESDASNLFDEWARSFAGDLVAPLLDAGQREAEVDRTRAIRMQRLYEYGQTILTAFREVEDALIQEKKQLQRIRSLEEQVRLAKETYERLKYEYFNGAGDYIDVLAALTDEQRLRRDLLSARLALLEFRIALYRALAGGFKTSREAEDNGASARGCRNLMPTAHEFSIAGKTG